MPPVVLTRLAGVIRLPTSSRKDTQRRSCSLPPGEIVNSRTHSKGKSVCYRRPFSSRAHDCPTLMRLRRFFEAVIGYTGTAQIDVIAHSMGVTLTRKVLKGGLLRTGTTGTTIILISLDQWFYHRSVLPGSAIDESCRDFFGVVRGKLWLMYVQWRVVDHCARLQSPGSFTLS